MTPRHPLSAPDMPLHEGVLWLEEKLLDLAADLSNLIEEHGIGDEGSARRIPDLDRQWIQHLVFVLVNVEERPIPQATPTRAGWEQPASAPTQPPARPARDPLAFVTAKILLTRLPSRAELHADAAAPEKIMRCDLDPRPSQAPPSGTPETIRQPGGAGDAR